ncbi:hypothetical protein GCM10023330_07300 [Litoribaculum gwangyangense]|uniref:Uncharacterized protein n=1 Tax=Litoribaculum gwangyangense TaxID=1130722 RepID=A0ABP9C1L3_9FLAO
MIKFNFSLAIYVYKVLLARKNIKKLCAHSIFFQKTLLKIIISLKISIENKNSNDFIKISGELTPLLANENYSTVTDLAKFLG